MRKSMLEAGISLADIEEICRLEEAYSEVCEEIAAECAEEGKPDHGADYDLRCAARRESYDREIDLILSSYEDSED